MGAKEEEGGGDRKQERQERTKCNFLNTFYWHILCKMCSMGLEACISL